MIHPLNLFPIPLPSRHFHKSYVEARPKTLSCLDTYLETWMSSMKASDAVVKEIPPSSKDNRFYSFTGEFN